MFTIAASSFYTYLKLSKVLTRRAECVQLGLRFDGCVRCGREPPAPDFEKK